MLLLRFLLNSELEEKEFFDRFDFQKLAIILIISAYNTSACPPSLKGTRMFTSLDI